jgi:radial spoke head protein 4A
MTTAEPSKDLLQSFASNHPALASHLTELISHLIQHQPPNPFQHLEQLAFNLSASRAAPSSPVSSHPLLSSPPSPALSAYLAASPFIFNKPPAKAVSEDEEPQAEEEDRPVPAFVPDVASLCALLQEAGTAVSDNDAVLVNRAVVLLGQRDGVESVRWWGRVLTTAGNDYFVFEVKRGSYDEEEEAERVVRERRIAATGEDVTAHRELLGAGANEYLYYVSQSLSSPVPSFSLLPSTSPRFITDARRTHRLLSGDLTAAVGGFPRFAGVEADLLRAQIARISNGSVLVPKGSWKEEEGDVVLEDAEWKGTERGQPVLWQHGRGNIRRDGRVEQLPEEEEEEADEDEAVKLQKAAAKAAAAEPKLPLLAAASECAFTSRVSQQQDAAGSEVHSALSLLWPGSVSAVRGREYGSLYVGWAVKQRLDGGALRVTALDPQQAEWAGAELVEEAELLPTAEEEKKEKEEEEERKREEAEAGGEEKKKEEEDDGVEDLPDDEDDKKEEEED